MNRVLETGSINSCLKTSCSHWVPSEVWTRVWEKRRVFSSANVFDKECQGKRSGAASTDEFWDEVREKDAAREDADEKCSDVKTQIWNSEAGQKRRQLLSPRESSPIVSRGRSDNVNPQAAHASSSRELTESATKEKYEVASSEHSRSTRTNRWGNSKSPRTPQPQPQRQKWQSTIQPLDTDKCKFESNLWKPRSEKSNPTSGHLKMKILNQPLDT